MKSINQLTTLLLTVAMLFCGQAYAGSPSINKITVQGYLKLAGGAPVSETSADLAFVIYKGSVAPGNEIWGILASAVPLSSGLFSYSMSSTGTNNPIAGCGAPCATFSTTTLDTALLMSGGTGDLIVHVEAISNIEGNKPSFDITLDSVPTAFVAQQANSVTDASITVASLVAGAKTAAFTGTAGQLVLTNGTGYISSALLTPINAATQFTGVTPIANGGTNNGSLGVTAGGVTYGDGSKLMMSAAGTSGYYLTSAGAGAPTWSSPAQVLAAVGGAASGTNTDIIGLGNLTTAITMAQGGTGAALTATNGGIIYSGAGTMGVSAAGTSGQVLISGGAASPTWTTSLGIAQGGTNNGSLGVTAGGVTYGDGSKLMMSAAGTAGNLFTSNGAGVPSWTSTVGISQGGTANNALGITAGGVVYTDGTKLMNSGAAIASGYFLTSGGVGVPTWTAPSSMLGAIGGAASGANSDITSLTNLTTALSVAQGGTGATSVAGARSALSAAASGANSDIMSMTNVSAISGIANLSLASAAGSTTTVGDNTSTSASVLRSGTGGLSLSSTGTSSSAISITASGAGGGISLAAGATTGGVAGGFTLTGGAATTGSGGGFSFSGGSASGVAGTGGGFSVTGGGVAVAGGGAAGSVNLTGGSVTVATAAGPTPGAVALAGGSSTVNSGTGGAVTITGGNNSGTTSTGGSVTINAGTGTTANGSINIGTATTSSINFGTGATVVLPMSTAPSFGRFMGYNAIPGAATWTPVGIAAHTLAGVAIANADTNNAPFIRFGTTTAAANNCGGFTSPLVGRVGGNLTYSWRLLTEAVATTAARFAFGLASTGSTLAVANGCNVAANGPAHADASLREGAYFRYSTTVPDTNWVCKTCDGAACTSTDSGVAVANTTEYNMKIVTSSTKVLFYINDTLVCTNSSNLPAAATNLVMYMGANETTATNKVFSVSHAYVTGR